jgi:hypothetical protein
MTVINTRNIDMARATEVDPCSPCFFSIFSAPENLTTALRDAITNSEYTTGQTTTANLNGTSYTSGQEIQPSLSLTLAEGVDRNWPGCILVAGSDFSLSAPVWTGAWRAPED